MRFVAMFKKISAVFVWTCVICTGCVSYPFIDDSIAKLEANPVPVIERFKLPETPPLAIPVQSAEMLVGSWETGIQHPCFRDVRQDGLIHEYDKPNRYYNDAAEVYIFNSDGSFDHFDIGRHGALGGILVLTVKKSGMWLYEAGVLTLQCKKVKVTSADYLAKQLGSSNWKSTILDRECADVLTRHVDWFADNEITIKQDTEAILPQTGPRKAIKVDAYGVKTEREIKVMGVEQGRETGTVSETVYPPMHFKKKGNKK